MFLIATRCIYDEFKVYDFFDINFVIDYFLSYYVIENLIELDEYEHIERYNLLNSDIEDYINKYYDIIKYNAPEKGTFEFGFLFDSYYCNIDEFIDDIKLFVFISILCEKTLKNYKQQIFDSLEF